MDVYHVAIFRMLRVRTSSMAMCHVIRRSIVWVTYTSISINYEELSDVDYVPGPEYPEYLAPSNEEVPIEDQPYVVVDSPIALPLGYIVDSDPEEDSEDGPADYLADEDDDDESTATPPSPLACRTTDRMEDIPEVELPPHKRLCLTAPTSRYEVGESLTASRPTRGHREVYRFIGTLDAETRRQRADKVDYGIRDVWVDLEKAVEEVVPTTLEGDNSRVTEIAEAPMPSLSKAKVKRLLTLPTPPPSPLNSLSPPSTEKRLAREDIPEVELPPHKRLCLTALTSRYEVGESLTASRPTRGHREVYGFISTLDAETRRQRADKVDYGIRDVWVDLEKAVEEVVLTTLEGDNSRVTEIAEEALTVTLVAQVSFLQGQLSAALGQIQALQARDPTHEDDPEGADSCA
nr:hypothetical protein [Tanacetum cinerariifolium]